ncbi:MAG: ATP-binding cassette domain-containing protein, partial [Gammaproteobacteria bacterium]
EQWALLGPNGAGKTVLAALATGELHPAGGEAWLSQGIDTARDVGRISFELERRICEDDARHDISEYLESAVDQGTTAAALLAVPGADPAAAEALVAALGIAPLLARGLRFLSSGERRRVLLARLLLARPRVAVLDAPFEGIDAHSRALVAGMLDTLLDTPSHVLLLTRRATEIPPGITHVLRLAEGRIVDAGPREDVLSRLRPGAAGHAVGSDPPLPDSDTAEPCPEGPLIELHNVSASYGERLVLEGVNLRLERGEHLCIAGPNGCGKSTLLALVCGDNPRAYGQEVRVCGRLRGDGEPVWELKRRFGIVSNALHLDYPRRTRILDVVASGFHDTLGLYESCSARELGIARGWLGALGPGVPEGGRFDALSFGVQRLVLLARAMVKAPPILILDEPLSGLDAPNRERVLGFVERIAATGRTQLLYVTHEQGEMPRCITRRLEFRPRAEGGYALQEA